ncbi:MAG: hypothetical protein QOF46_429 [Paraburkholderia sp.]|nr:hypothetical protein [Paraburkholderia sp.]
MGGAALAAKAERCIGSVGCALLFVLLPLFRMRRSHGACGCCDQPVASWTSSALLSAHCGSANAFRRPSCIGKIQP